MAEEPTTPTASKNETTSSITVDVKEANDATISESQTTPTPSKTQFNANAVEFVPGQFRASTAPNPAAPVFTPQFQLTENGYVPINPYSMPYYMYVPSNGATGADGSTVAVSPAMTYQPRSGYGKGGLSRHNSAGARSARSEGPTRGKGGFRSTKEIPKEEPVKSSDSPVIRPEEFPSMLGSSAIDPESSEEEGKPSWAAMAKKATGAPKQSTPVLIPVSPMRAPEPLPVSPKAEPPKEPVASALPVSGKPKLAPWAPAVVVEEAVEEAKPEVGVADVTDGAKSEDMETEDICEEARPADDVEESVGSAIEKRTYPIDFLRRLRYHESCRPSAEVRAELPNGLLRQRGALGGGAEEAEDWRAAAEAESRGRRGRRGLSRSLSSRIEISAEMLLPSENSWSAAQQKKDEGLDENVKVGRKIFAVLNKLTVEKFGKLADQLFTECGITRPAHIVTLVKLLFDKATMQHHFIPMYADLCAKTLAWLGSEAAPEELVLSIGPGERSTAAAEIFRRVLLERCQERFYSYFISHEEGGLLVAADEEARQKHRLSMLGTVRFVAQLLERRLMTRGVFRNCLETLLNPEERTEDHVECACVFLSEVGRLFDLANGDQYSLALEDAMAELTEIAEESTTAPRIKFAVMNLVDLRTNGYMARAPSAGPAKLADVHRQAAKEDLARSASRVREDLARSATRVQEDEEWETVAARK